MNTHRKLRLAAGVLLILALGGFNTTLQAVDGGGGGGGGDPPPDPPSLEELMDEVQVTFDEGVQQGTISGKGRHFFGYLHLWFMAHALDQAALAIDEMRLEDALSWLAHAYQSCDGTQMPNPDLVAGDGVPELRGQIVNMMARIALLL